MVLARGRRRVCIESRVPSRSPSSSVVLLLLEDGPWAGESCPRCLEAKGWLCSEYRLELSWQSRGQGRGKPRDCAASLRAGDATGECLSA